MKDRVIKAIFCAIEEVNQQLPKENRLDKSVDVVLFDKTGSLDSLGLVTLIVAIEQKIEEEFGMTITLTDDRAIQQEDNFFRTIATLADYITLLLSQENK